MSVEPALEDRFVGCLLGHAMGDALGAPMEGMPATAIWYDLGGAAKFVRDPPLDVLVYTDDTQMSIAVAEALLAAGHADEQTLADAFAANYDPRRGYGAGARHVIEAMRDGGDWRTLAATMFPGGSFGNGAAMRAAPVGLLFHADLDRVAAEAAAQARLTHLHPIGIEGAQLIALAVALAVRDRGPFDRRAFFAELRGYATTEEFQFQLERAALWQPSDPVGTFGSSLPADRSVVTAIACFAATPWSYTDTIASAIALGDDTDTVAAMAGAICGARIGTAGLPAMLLDRLEDGPKGRRYIETLARRLAEVWSNKTC
jgi:poly(ADP-ribose) glycohydrolase ARH3